MPAKNSFPSIHGPFGLHVHCGDKPSLFPVQVVWVNLRGILFPRSDVCLTQPALQFNTGGFSLKRTVSSSTGRHWWNFKLLYPAMKTKFMRKVAQIFRLLIILRFYHKLLIHGKTIRSASTKHGIGHQQIIVFLPSANEVAER